MKSYTKKYVIVGCSNRGIEMFAIPIVKNFQMLQNWLEYLM